MKLYTLCAILGALMALPAIAATPEQQAIQMTKRWQNTLALNDWTITVHLVDLRDLPDGTAAIGKWDEPLHTGTILALKPSAYRDLATVSGKPELHGKAIMADIEDSIVHELIHLRLRTFANADAAAMPDAEEYTVVRLTTALLKAQRGK